MLVDSGLCTISFCMFHNYCAQRALCCMIYVTIDYGFWFSLQFLMGGVHSGAFRFLMVSFASRSVIIETRSSHLHPHSWNCPNPSSKVLNMLSSQSQSNSRAIETTFLQRMLSGLFLRHLFLLCLGSKKWSDTGLKIGRVRNCKSSWLMIDDELNSS